MELIFAVVELEQENGKDKVLTDTRLFSSREKGLAYLHRRYDRARLMVDVGAGELLADYSEDGWYIVVDLDGGAREGYLSEGLFVDEEDKGDKEE